MTATEVVDAISTEGKAMYTLSIVGNRGDDRQDERAGYNLLTFRQSLMGKNAHVWSRGDVDMGLLPKHITSVYDTTGWTCVNTYLDGDRVVFKRPPPRVPARGSCAQERMVSEHTQSNRCHHKNTFPAGPVQVDEGHGAMVRRQNKIT